MASSRMPRLMAWVARVWRSRCGWTPGTPAAPATRRTIRPMRCRSSGPRWSATSRLCARMWSRFAAVQAPSSPARSGCRGTYRSLRSLPSGIRSQCPAPICTTASASRSASSPARMPVRASSPATSRSRESALARAAAISLAASRSPGELRQRPGLFGDVPGDDRIARRRVRPVPLDDSPRRTGGPCASAAGASPC